LTGVLDCGAHVGDVSHPLCGLLTQATAEKRGNRRRCIGRECVPIGFGVQDCGQNFGCGLAANDEEARFAFEACEAVRLLRDAVREEFEGDLAAELGVASGEDFAHSAGAEWPQDVVRSQSSAAAGAMRVRADH
jgi:hypothetical protein